MGAKQVKKITSRYREIMRRLICGDAPVDIKRDIRMSDVNFSIVTNSELFLAEKEKMEKEIRDGLIKKLGEDRVLKPVDKILENAVEEAARMDVRLMQSGSERVRRDCAWDIMNRRGYKPKEHYEVEGAVVLKGEIAENVKKALEDINSDGTKK
jgi:hypothetical protein